MKTFVKFLFISALPMITATSLQAVRLESGQAPTPTMESKKSAAKSDHASQVLSYGIPEIVKMIEAGVDVSTIETYIQSSPTAYNPSAEDIVQLHQQGVPSSIITALIRHGKELREEWAQSQSTKNQVQQQQPSSTSSPTIVSAQPTFVPAPAQQNYYVYPNYGYPLYYPSYSYLYSAPLYFSYCYPQRRFQRFHPYVGFRYGRSYGSFGWSSPAFRASIGFGHGGRGAWRCR